MCIRDRETVCTARKTIRIAGDDYPAELVKSKFMKLNSSHVEFVLDCMRAVSYTHLDVSKRQGHEVHALPGTALKAAGVFIGNIDLVIAAALRIVGIFRQNAHHRIGHAADGQALAQSVSPECLQGQVGADHRCV